MSAIRNPLSIRVPVVRAKHAVAVIFFSMGILLSYSLSVHAQPAGGLQWDNNWSGNTFWCSGGTLTFYHYDAGGSTNNANWYGCNQ